MATVLLVVKINMIGVLLNAMHLPEGHKNIQHEKNRCTLLTMFAGLGPRAGFETLSPYNVLPTQLIKKFRFSVITRAPTESTPQ